MKYIILFIVFTVFYEIFYWIIKKTDICNKLFNNLGMRKHIRVIMIIGFFIFVFLIEYMKIIFKESYGFHSYISIITGAFLGAVYLNFIPLMFKKDR